MQDLKHIDELLFNPFAGRIAEVFSDDGTGRLSFKNFLELFAVFSPQANFDVKIIFLFAIWDFDGALHHILMQFAPRIGAHYNVQCAMRPE